MYFGCDKVVRGTDILDIIAYCKNKAKDLELTKAILQLFYRSGPLKIRWAVCP